MSEILLPDHLKNQPSDPLGTAGTASAEPGAVPETTTTQVYSGPQWQYLAGCSSAAFELFTPDLKHLGEFGWELIVFQMAAVNGKPMFFTVYKRLKTDPPQPTGRETIPSIKSSTVGAGIEIADQAKADQLAQFMKNTVGRA